MKQPVARVYTPLSVAEFNADGIARQRHGVSKQLQELCIDVILVSATYFKSHKRIFNSNYHVYRTDRFPDTKGGTAVAIRNGVPINHLDLLPLFL
jgi:hypothetical protein